MNTNPTIPPPEASTVPKQGAIGGRSASAGSVEYRRGYANGYQAGFKRGLREAKQAPRDERKHETGDGYVCKTCGIQRPRDWFVYEIEKEGQWLTPCCAMCARENNSRGPFPPNA